MFATGYDGIREGQVCAAAGLTAFDEDWRGIWPLLARWGGEAIYHHADAENRARLRTIGSPAIVVLDLPLTESWLMFPSLANMLAGHFGAFSSPGADVVYQSDVPASAVVDVWQPGRPEYDRFVNLPRD